MHFFYGIRNGAGISLGYIPAALTFGLLAKEGNLTLMQTVGMSLFVFAGAAQYMSLQLLALGTGIAEVILATFLINLRHILMSTAVHKKMVTAPIWKRAAVAFGITDETFAVATSTKASLHFSYMLGLISAAYASWVIFSGVGYGIGDALPGPLKEGMSIALYALFIGLLAPSLKSRKVVLLAGTAAACHALLSTVLAKGWAVVVATLLSVAVYETFSKGREVDD